MGVGIQSGKSRLTRTIGPPTTTNRGRFALMLRSKHGQPHMNFFVAVEHAGYRSDQFSETERQTGTNSTGETLATDSLDKASYTGTSPHPKQP